ncbi:MAG TPA: metalloregulator ArsR/SmtB family transcription factor [Planctomycetota bacterium]|nr:metalloregulator ArsR/SmtB family transcription factor [Planctomycetota bacterium]
MTTAAAPRPPALFRAFSDPTRLRILHLLRDGELCVCDLMRILRVPQAKTSRHLAYLRRSGLVIARQDGLWSYYSLSPARGPVHRRLLSCLDVCCRELPAILADSRRASSIRKGAACCLP